MNLKRICGNIIPVLISLILSCNQPNKKDNLAYKRNQPIPPPDLDSFIKYNSRKSKKKKQTDTNNFFTFIEKIPQRTREELKQSLSEITSPRMKKE